MGSLLDSSVLIAAERDRQTAAGLMRAISRKIGEEPVALSAVVYTELLHGLYRERDLNRFEVRMRFYRDILQWVPVYPYTEEIALLAGRVGGQQASIGETVPFADLPIGVTALHLGFSILTLNERHFRMIPDLKFIPF